MPKIKTHSGAKKRFSKTKTGRIKFKTTDGRHLLTGKSNPRKRRLATDSYVAPGHEKLIGRLLPNG